MNKKCTRCGTKKPHTEFARREASKDGLAPICRACKSVVAKELYARTKPAVMERIKRNEVKRRTHDPAWRNAWNVWQRCQKIHRVPPWVNFTLDTLPIYRHCKACGPLFEVDHIIPLKGEKVSGLHVPANLQVITTAENRTKGSTFAIDLSETL